MPLAVPDITNNSTEPKLPPMLLQYLEYKTQYPDTLLLFQVGDFYELFFEDAVTVAKALNLTLTSRDKNSANPVPMCGVPVAVVDGYLERLVAQGFSAAVVSQCEEALPGKGMVKRRLERIVTPGVKILSPADDDAAQECFVAAIYPESEGDAAIAFSSIQSAKVFLREGIALSALRQELSRITPAEIILPNMIEGRPIDRRLPWVRDVERQIQGGTLKFRGESYILPGGSRETGFSSLSGYSALSATAKKALRLLVNYIDETTCGLGVKVMEVAPKYYDQSMIIDATTRTNLELVRNARDGTKRGTLLQYLDETCSSGGRRMLNNWILSPLIDGARILQRYDAVRALLKEGGVRVAMRRALGVMTDLERIAARVELKVVSPRELGALREALQHIPELQRLTGEVLNDQGAAVILREFLTKSEIDPALLQLLEKSLVDSPPPTVNEGGAIRAGFSAELDKFKEVKEHGTSWIAEIEGRERQRTGISSLKIRYNNVIGYFIEVTKANLQRVPEDYIRRQSMVGGERFTTTELREREKEVLGAEAKQIELEKKLFDEVRLKVLAFTAAIRQLAEQVATLDVLLALAQVAEREDLHEPELISSSDLKVESGMHPILARLLRGRFIPNSLQLREHGRNFAVVTGPNMGGKSTYLRQNAIIVIMAQLGSFVPAKNATVGIVDKIFARLGASDDLQEGESTFMVEMREISQILANATPRSLLLIDEVGRGTATADGLSIARAILEWIVVRVKCRTLFATHFHELTQLSEVYPALFNLSVASAGEGGEVVFTHEIKEGPANKSYGLEVAKLAGLPAPLIMRAKQILSELSLTKESEAATKAEQSKQLSIFTPAVFSDENPTQEVPADYEELKTLRARIDALDINSMTPLEAINMLQVLKVKRG